MDIRNSLSMKDNKAQLQAEVKMLTSEERRYLLTSAGITVDIPPEQGLAIKANLAIPWNKLRIIRRYSVHPPIISHIQYIYTHAALTNKINNRRLTTWNIQIVSERSLWKRWKAVISDNLKSEVAPLTFSLKSGGEEIWGCH